MRITKTTDARSWWEYRAALQACCIHRWFCAADASTPVRSESEGRISYGEKVNRENRAEGSERRTGSGRELRQHLLCEEIAAEGDTAAQGDGREVSAHGPFAVRPGP
jgi:hypothetical protein